MTPSIQTKSVLHSRQDIADASERLFKTFGGSYATWGHWVHNTNFLLGALHVGLERLSESKGSLLGAALWQPVFSGLAQLALWHSDIEKAINYEVEMLSSLAQQIHASNNDRLKQLHITFSNAGYVFNEALKRLSAEERNTVIVITTGTTKIIDPKSAHKVYNVIGNKDTASIFCNGGRAAVNAARDEKRAEIVEQHETRPWISGHYNDQPDYQLHTRKIIEEKIKGLYEVH